MVTSPNYPDNYPDNFKRTDVIQVESGKILRLEFTNFEVEFDSWCGDDYDYVYHDYDYVKITDGNGTTLMDRSCGYSSYDPSHSYYFLPPSITTSTNRVEILFFTDGQETSTGWSLSWSAVTPGEKALLVLN